MGATRDGWGLDQRLLRDRKGGRVTSYSWFSWVDKARAAALIS